MDILELLEADQDALRSLIIELKIADDDSSAEAEAFTALVSSAKQQAEAREQLFATLEADGVNFGPLTQALAEKLEGAREVERMIECCTNRATWRSSIMVYCEMLETTIELESKTLLPQIFDSFQLPARQKLGSKYRAFRGFTRRRGAEGRTNWMSRWNHVLNQAG